MWIDIDGWAHPEDSYDPDTWAESNKGEVDWKATEEYRNRKDRATAYDGEEAMTERVFESLSTRYPYLIMDYADSGNEIFVTNPNSDECFTIRVVQDE